MAFDPDAYLAKAKPASFDPDAYLKSTAPPDAVPVVKDDYEAEQLGAAMQRLDNGEEVLPFLPENPNKAKVTVGLPEIKERKEDRSLFDRLTGANKVAAAAIAAPLAEAADFYTSKDKSGFSMANSAGVTALNSGALGLGPRLMAAQDATDAITGPREDETVTDISSALKRMKGVMGRNAKSSLEFIKAPIETSKKFKEAYDTSLEKNRAGFSDAVAANPKSAFVGGMAPALASVPKSAAQVGITALANALGGTSANYDDVLTGDTDALKTLGSETAMSVGPAMAGFKFPGTTAATMLAAPTVAEWTGHEMSPEQATQLRMSGSLGLGARGINALQNVAKGRSTAFAKKADAAHLEATAKDRAALPAANEKVRAANESVRRQVASDAQDLQENRIKKNNAGYDKFEDELNVVGKQRVAENDADATNQATKKAAREEARAASNKALEDSVATDLSRRAEADAAKKAAEDASNKVLIESFLASERKKTESQTPQKRAGKSVEPEKNIDAQADALLGNEVKKALVRMRNNPEGFLEWSDQAKKGFEAVKPDYQADSNQVLEGFADGKAAVRAKIMEKLLAERSAKQGQTPVQAAPEDVIPQTEVRARPAEFFLKPPSNDTVVDAPSPFAPAEAPVVAPKVKASPTEALSQRDIAEIAKRLGLTDEDVETFRVARPGVKLPALPTKQVPGKALAAEDVDPNTPATKATQRPNSSFKPAERPASPTKVVAPEVMAAKAKENVPPDLISLDAEPSYFKELQVLRPTEGRKLDLGRKAVSATEKRDAMVKRIGDKEGVRAQGKKLIGEEIKDTALNPLKWIENFTPVGAAAKAIYKTPEGRAYFFNRASKILDNDPRLSAKYSTLFASAGSGRVPIATLERAIRSDPELQAALEEPQEEEE